MVASRLGTGSLVPLLKVRLFRACGTSAVSGPTQLGVYLLLRRLAWPPPAANAGALLVVYNGTAGQR